MNSRTRKQYDGIKQFGRADERAFICTDQQRARDVGFMGNDVVQTPHLDALAAESMVFDNAWCRIPFVCLIGQPC